MDPIRFLGELCNLDILNNSCFYLCMLGTHIFFSLCMCVYVHAYILVHLYHRHFSQDVKSRTYPPGSGADPVNSFPSFAVCHLYMTRNKIEMQLDLCNSMEINLITKTSNQINQVSKLSKELLQQNMCLAWKGEIEIVSKEGLGAFLKGMTGLAVP